MTDDKGWRDEEWSRCELVEQIEMLRTELDAKERALEMMAESVADGLRVIDAKDKALTETLNSHAPLKREIMELEEAVLAKDAEIELTREQLITEQTMRREMQETEAALRKELAHSTAFSREVERCLRAENEKLLGALESAVCAHDALRYTESEGFVGIRDYDKAIDAAKQFLAETDGGE